MVIVRGGARRIAALVIVEDVGAVMLEGVIVGVAACVIFRGGRESERRERVRPRGV